MAELEISKSYAILLTINEGLFHLKKITPEDYELFQKRYTRKLVDVIAENAASRENSHTPVLEKEREKAELAKMERHFGMIVDQWNLHPQQERRKKWREEAEKWADKVPSAKLILNLANVECLEVAQ
jgi:hypothetical protein